MNLLSNQQAAEAVDGIYQDLEAQLMQNIARHLSDWKQPIATDRWLLKKLAEIGKLNKENISAIARMSGMSRTTAERMLNEAAEEAIENIDPGLKQMAKDNLAGEMVSAAKSRNVRQTVDTMRKQAKDTLNLCNTTMLYKARDAYSKLVRRIAAEAGELENKQEFLDTLNKYAEAVTAGVESRQQAVRKCIREFNEKGIPAFVDKRGREWTPEAYVNMAMRNTVRQTAEEVQTARCKDAGVNLIQIDSHSGARPKCAKDQGKIFSLDNTSGETEDLYGKKIRYYPWKSSSYGEPDGLLGINCRHHKYPFSPGVSIRRYFPTDDFKENDRLYKETQVQRALERDVRKQKRECMLYDTVGDTESFEKASVKLKSKEASLKDYVDKNPDLHRRKDREQVVGFDKRMSAEAVAANKKVQKRLAEKVRDDKIKAEIKSKGLVGEIDLYPKIPDVQQLTFDNEHINEQRKHNVSEAEAKKFIKNAKFTVTKWNGKFTNYYSQDGATYVNNETKHIRTAFKAEQYDDAAKGAMEVISRGRT